MPEQKKLHKIHLRIIDICKKIWQMFILEAGMALSFTLTGNTPHALQLLLAQMTRDKDWYLDLTIHDDESTVARALLTLIEARALLVCHVVSDGMITAGQCTIGRLRATAAPGIRQTIGSTQFFLRIDTTALAGCDMREMGVVVGRLVEALSALRQQPIKLIKPGRLFQIVHM